MTANLKRILLSAGIPVIAAAAFLFTSAVPVSAGGEIQGHVRTITLEDTAGTGKIDIVEIHVDNPSLTTWTVNGIPNFVIHDDGGILEIPVDSVDVTSGPGVDPMVLDLHLHQANVIPDTSPTAVGVSYTQSGDPTTNSISDGTTEMQAIAFSDFGGGVYTDDAQPVLLSISPANATVAAATAPLVLTFSEPMDMSSVGASFSPSPTFTTTAATPSDGDRVLTVTHPAWLVGTRYTLTLTPGGIMTADDSRTLNPSDALGLDDGSFFTVTGGHSSGASPAMTLYTPPTSTCVLLAPLSGTTVTAGASYQMSWSGNAQGLTNALFSYSGDGGATWKTLGGSFGTSGTLSWSVPETNSSTAQIKVDCRNGGGSVLASMVSGNFNITGGTSASAPAPVATPTPTPTPVSTYTPVPFIPVPAAPVIHPPASAPVAAPVMKPVVVVVPVVHPAPIYTRTLTLGSNGADVTTLQKFLVSKHLLVWPKGAAYGTFGPLTRTALKKLQAGWKLPVTGMVDVSTRAALNPR